RSFPGRACASAHIRWLRIPDRTARGGAQRYLWTSRYLHARSHDEDLYRPSTGIDIGFPTLVSGTVNWGRLAYSRDRAGYHDPSIHHLDFERGASGGAA